MTKQKHQTFEILKTSDTTWKVGKFTFKSVKEARGFIDQNILKLSKRCFVCNKIYYVLDKGGYYLNFKKSKICGKTTCRRTLHNKTNRDRKREQRRSKC